MKFHFTLILALSFLLNAEIRCFVPKLLYSATINTYGFFLNDEKTIPHYLITRNSLIKSINKASISIDNEKKTKRFLIFESSLLAFEEAKFNDLFFGLQTAYLLSREFKVNVEKLLESNENVDSDKLTKHNPIYHFDAEKFVLTNDRLIKQKKDIIENIKKKNYKEAIKDIGKYTHTLQDFYSHSNWVEMGKTDINYDIGETPLKIDISSTDEITCIDCETDYTCQNNIIESINLNQKLTSGYCSDQVLNNKPVLKPINVKCSHGGFIDDTKELAPIGGINKDSASKLFSPHYYLHGKAVDLAKKATEHFFESIRNEVSNENFLCLFGVYCAKDVVFYIDASSSMSSIIETVKETARKYFDTAKKYIEEKTTQFLNATISFFDKKNFLPLTKTTFTNLTTIESFRNVLNDITLPEPEYYFEEKCDFYPFPPYLICTNVLKLRPDLPDPTNLILRSLFRRVNKKATILIATDSPPSDRNLNKEVGTLIKINEYKFECLFCPENSIYDTYTEISNQANNEENVTNPSNQNDPEYALISNNGESLVEKCFDTFYQNITIKILTNEYFKFKSINLATNETFNIEVKNSSSNNHTYYVKGGGWCFYFEFKGKYNLSIYFNSMVDIQFSFVTPVAESTHPSLYHYEREPYINEEVTVFFDLSSTNITLSQLFVLSFSSDIVLSNHSLIQDDLVNSSYFVKIKTPNEKFYYLINGIDATYKNKFERSFKTKSINPLKFQIDLKRVNENQNEFYLFITNLHEPSLVNINLFTETPNSLFYNITPNNFNLNNLETKNTTLYIPLINDVSKSEKITLKAYFTLSLNNSLNSVYVLDQFDLELNTNFSTGSNSTSLSTTSIMTGDSTETKPSTLEFESTSTTRDLKTTLTTLKLLTTTIKIQPNNNSLFEVLKSFFKNLFKFLKLIN